MRRRRSHARDRPSRGADAGARVQLEGFNRRGRRSGEHLG